LINTLPILKLLIDNDSVRILRSKYFSILVYASVMLGAVFFGLLLIFEIRGSGVPAFIQYVGYLMLAVALVMLMRLPWYVRKLKSQGGDLIFQANREGIRVVPERLQGTTMWNSPLSVVELNWQDVKGMACGQWLEQKTIMKKYSTHGKMVIFVEPPAATTVERLYKYSEKAPDGRTVVVVPFSTENFSRFRLAIEGLSEGRIIPEMCGTIVFDYRNKKVLYKGGAE